MPCPQRCWLALAAFAFQAAADRGLFYVTPVVNNCFFEGHRYEALSGNVWGRITTAGDVRHCQRLCQSSAQCSFFNFWKNHSCGLLAESAVFTSHDARECVTGPKRCPDTRAACTENPGEGFPGQTAVETMLTWPSHRVPDKLECWPRNSTGGFYDSCGVLHVLEDTAAGWPVLCHDLSKVEQLPPGETCASYCGKRLMCRVYKVGNDSQGTCYHSLISSHSHCYPGTAKSASDLQNVKAKRLLHGEVRVLGSTIGVEIGGLSKVFDHNFLADTGHAVSACRNNCYSNIGCQWWQYSSETGCWAEDPREPVEVPITTATWRRGTPAAKSVVAGEYIQHFCPGHFGLPPSGPAIATSFRTTPKPPPPPAALSSTAAPVPPATTPAVVRGGLVHSATPQPGLQPTLPAPAAPAAGAGAGSSTLPPAHSGRDVEVGGTFQGAMDVQGLAFDDVTASQRAELSSEFVKAIAAAAGVAPERVLDESKTPGQVTLGPALGTSPGTRAGFFVDVQKGVTQNTVNRALLDQGFLAHIRDVSSRVSGVSKSALASIDVHVDRTTPYPFVAYPDTTTTLEAAAASGNGTFGNLDWGSAAAPRSPTSRLAIVLGLLVLVAGVCAMTMCARRSDGGHAKHKNYHEFKKRDGALRAEKWDDTDGSFFDEPPPPEPVRRNLQTSESNAESESGMPLLSEDGTRAYMDPRRAVMDTFDTIDTNKDGVLSPQELARAQAQNLFSSPLLQGAQAAPQPPSAFLSSPQQQARVPPPSSASMQMQQMQPAQLPFQAVQRPPSADWNSSRRSYVPIPGGSPSASPMAPMAPPVLPGASSSHITSANSFVPDPATGRPVMPNVRPPVSAPGSVVIGPARSSSPIPGALGSSIRAPPGMGTPGVPGGSPTGRSRSPTIMASRLTSSATGTTYTSSSNASLPLSAPPGAPASAPGSVAVRASPQGGTPLQGTAVVPGRSASIHGAPMSPRTLSQSAWPFSGAPQQQQPRSVSPPLMRLR